MYSVSRKNCEKTAPVAIRALRFDPASVSFRTARPCARHRDDVTLHQQYMADIAESSRKAIDSADLTRYFEKYGENVWPAFKGGLDEMVATAAAPVIEKYTGMLAAADVFTESTTFQVMQSIRLDLGHGSWVHP